MSRRYADDVSVDRYEDRRDTYASRNGRRYDDRYTEEDIDYRRGPPVRERERERERETIVREEIRERPGRTPAFLEEGYGRTSAGPVVLRKRETEDFDFVPRPRRRSPSPEPERKIEKEEIIIRRDASPEPPPPPRLREREVDREEIIIRRDERDTSRQPPRRERDRDVEREEIIIRRDEKEPDRRPPPPRRGADREREEIIIRRDDRERDIGRSPASREVNSNREEIIIRKDERERSPPPREVNTSREEIVIRRNDDERRGRYYDDDDVISRRGDYDRRPARGDVDRQEIIIRRDEASNSDDRRYDDYPLVRPKSHERARSRHRRSSSASNEEIIIRNQEREGRNGTRNQQEIIIRRNSRSRSPATSVTSARTAPRYVPPEPQVINAPTIHQEVITHHRHIDHGFEVSYPQRPRVVERPPSPPSPPLAPIPPPARSEERIEISRVQTRNGRTEAEDIVIDRRDGGRAASPQRSVTGYPPPAVRDPYYEPGPPRRDHGRFDRDVHEEAQYYNDRAMERAYVGEANHGATRDWAIVDVPPGTNRVQMDGAGGGSQEITWQRYNGVRRSKFMPDGADERYDGALTRPAPLPAPAPLPSAGGDIGRRYGRERDAREGLWTEITKDLVVKEAIQELGYEFEETDDFYYIIAYLRYVSPSSLPSSSPIILQRNTDNHHRRTSPA
jgi:hypothetical protein